MSVKQAPVDTPILDEKRKFWISDSWKRWFSQMFLVWRRTQNYGVADVPSSVSSGGTYTAQDGFDSVILDPAADLAAYTVALPPNPQDKDVYWITSTKLITALTLTATGATINSPPASLLPSSSVLFQYVQSNTTWYRRL